jgi:hypothetical protein
MQNLNNPEAIRNMMSNIRANMSDEDRRKMEQMMNKRR